ncbi:MAG: hypothetical protein ACOC6Q_02505 [Patescibacteria group bacterium]
MKILKRQEEDKKWKTYTQRSYKDEAELQDIIYEDPRIIPINEISEDRKEIKIAIKEFGLPGTGSSDIIGIDEDGKITIIEAKLAVNPEIKRKVIGQILEYAAFLWRKTYEQFDSVIEEKNGKPLLDLMADLVEDQNWSEEEFRKAVGTNLYNGDFSLFILVDDVDDSLKRILEFINSSSFSGPQIYALAARYFKDAEGSEFLIPQIYGVNIKQTEAREEQSSKRKKWDKQELVDQAGARLENKELSLFKKLYELFEELGEIKFGSGVETGTFGLAPKGKPHNPTIWTVDTKGLVRLGLGWLVSRNSISEEDVKPLVNLVKNLASDFEDGRDWHTYYPAFEIKKLKNKNNLEIFLEKTRKLLKTMKDN